MKFGRTYEQLDARRRAKRARGKFLLFPRTLDTGRWAWLERVPYQVRCDRDGSYTTYFDVPKGDA